MSESNEEIEFVEEAPETNLDTELETYSEGVQKRINAEVAKRGALERELAATREKLEMTGRVAHSAIEENKRLKATSVEADKAILEGLVGRMESELEIAKTEFRKATEEADPEKIAEATSKLATAASDLRTVQLRKAGYREPVEVPVQPEPQQPQRKAAQPKALAWVERNRDKYGVDPEWTREARAADVMVAALGIDPSSDDYYNEVDRVIEMRLSAKSGGAARDKAPAHTPVTPSGRAGVPPRQPAGKVTLTPSEVATAKRMGLSLENYAAAKRAGNVVLG